MQFGDRIPILKDILRDYLPSIGIFREFLQNSDDAGASKQIFVLDHRRHGTNNLYDPIKQRLPESVLMAMQGPALLAYNDALFKESDWKALSTSHSSSKGEETLKIGTFGKGFRSSYHYTDSPQILSGPSLCLFDPLRSFSDVGGCRLEFTQDANALADHLSGFDFFVEDGTRDFDGSVFRLPLRSSASELNAKPISPEEARQFLLDFIREELHICLLFLEHVDTVEVHEILADGTKIRLASSCKALRTIEGLSFTEDFLVHTTPSAHNIEIRSVNPGHLDASVDIWQIQKLLFSQEDVISRLNDTIGGDVSKTIQRNKLVPDVRIAIPIIAPPTPMQGRLYTHLPLPIKTGLPAHIHSRFALTSSRQHLVNADEVGVARGTDASVFVEWNKLLFERYIPLTWALLIRNLLHRSADADLFRAWPVSAISGPWNNLSVHLFDTFKETNDPIWPIISLSGTSKMHSDFTSIIFASPNKTDELLQALASFGLCICQAPKEIFDLASGSKCRILTPDIAYEALLECKTLLHEAAARRSIVLQYLISQGNIKNLARLPIFTLESGEHVSLDLSESTLTSFTLMQEAESTLFGHLDPSTLSLVQIDKPVSEILVAKGPSFLNVCLIDAEKVRDYLYSAERLTVGNTEQSLVDWLSAFWGWASQWASRDRLLGYIGSANLLSTGRGLTAFSSRVFIADTPDRTLSSSLENLGLRFLSDNFPSQIEARRYLMNAKSFFSIQDLHVLLESIVPQCINHLNDSDADYVLKHLARCAPSSIGRKGPLNSQQLKILHSLRIFPVLKAGAIERTVVRACLSEGQDIIGICAKGFSVVPVISGSTFLDLSQVDADILRLFDRKGKVMYDIDLVQVSVNNIRDQTLGVQEATLRHIAGNKGSVPPKLLHQLASTPFIMATDGSTKLEPRNTINPDSKISCLYPDRLRPATSNSNQREIIRHLRDLDLIRSSLTREIVRERIIHISHQSNLRSATTLASHLITLLNGREHLFPDSDIAPTLSWLPTNQGLRGSGQCRDSDSLEDLFDEIMPVLNYDIRPSLALREKFGWCQPFTLAVLVEQVTRIIANSSPIPTLKIISVIKELAKRKQSLTEQDYNYIRNVLGGHAWIPVVGNGVAATVQSTVLVDPLPGFYLIHRDLSGESQFLLTLGCAERPTFDTILTMMQSREKALSTSDMIVLLRRLVDIGIPDERREELLIPDKSGKLCKFSNIYFDTNKGSSPNLCTAHSDIDQDLAAKLSLKRPALSYDMPQMVQLDMGEPLERKIRRELLQYTPNQFITEFVANAIDAGAKKIRFLLDHAFHFEAERLLSSTLQRYNTCPSIVVYNDSIFKDEDFHGICNTGLGSKHERSDTIGLYGSGALTMFHFTEFVTIVSGEYVLFIDLMKNILPGSTRVAKARLSMINSQYPDQLRPLHGLYGFDASLDHFPGTIFRLPLRESAHTENRNNLLSTLWSPAKAESVIEAFRASISEFCLFTGIDAIGIDSRHGELNQTTFAVQRNLKTDDSICTELVAIPGVKQTWLIVSSCTGDKCADVSEEFNRRYRPRSPIRAGIAANITDTRNVPNRPNGPQSFKFFSTLPLALENHLPVHINAPFILSSDRRQIRFDEYESSEKKYNSWLLSKILPPLYIALLERLIPHCRDNALWWPTDRTHHLSSVLVREFYQQLAGNETPLLYSKYGRPLSPIEAYITKPREPNVKVVKEFLSNLPCEQYVSLPSSVRNCLIELSGLIAVGPEHLRRVILRDPSRTAQIFDCNRSEDRKDLQELVAFVSRNSPADLIDLPLIPLANGQLAEYRKSFPTEQSYYVYDDWVRLAELFDNAYLVNPKYNVDGRLLESKAGLNIRRFDGPALEVLLTNHLECSPVADGVSPDKQNWIGDFWSLYRSFPFDAFDCIRSFPLVPTARGGLYLSLKQCEEDSVILFNGTEPAFMEKCLVMQGLDVVTRSHPDIHPACRELLGRYPMFSLDRLLSALDRPPGIGGRFARLDRRLQDKFAEWARSKVSYVTKEKIHLARQMPIWPSLSRTKQTITLRAAQEVQMLPFNVDEEVIRQFLMEPTSVYQFSLEGLQVKPLEFSALFSRLWLPRILSQAQMRIYKDLLKMVQPRHHVQKLQVPDGNRVMRPLEELYARDKLFLDAFERDRADKFVNDSYADVEPHLKSLGLQDQSKLDFDMFKACAEAISGEASPENGAELIRQAESIFQVCADDLPVREDRSWRWRELDDVRFIPINTSCRRSTLSHLDVSSFARPVQSIATPREVVVPKYEAIAWTQRALLHSSSSSKIQIVYDSFGCPDWTEVIEHLLALSRLAQTHEGEAAILADLKETYQWLENHFRDHEGADMLRHTPERLFLNVDDPSAGWTWHSASQLLLGMGEARNDYYPVASFLLSYPNLLHAAGVEKVNRNVQRSGDLEPAPQNGREVIQNKLLNMRRNGRLTDVVFDTRDGEVPAHRVLLQASIDHFANWADFNESTTSTANPARVEMDGYSHEMISLALDFAYTGTWENLQEIDYRLLIEMLELADFWGWDALSSIAQSMLFGKIDLFTFREIRTAAEAHHGTKLEQACNDFESNNINLIERFGLST